MKINGVSDSKRKSNINLSLIKKLYEQPKPLMIKITEIEYPSKIVSKNEITETVL